MRGGLLVVAVLLALLLGAEDPVEALDDALERPDVELHVLLDGLVLWAMKSEQCEKKQWQCEMGGLTMWALASRRPLYRSWIMRM